MSRYDPLLDTVQAWRADPALFVRQALGAEPQAWQEEALRAVVEHDRIAVRSGHGVGKSTFEAWLILWWHVTRYPAKTAATAPTQHQLQDILWSEIGRWHRQMERPFRDWLDITGHTLALRQAPKESFAVARTARPEQPEAFQGFHSENMLFVVDEASGVADVIFEVGAGAMSTAGAKTVMAGNPNRTSGYFADAFGRDRGRWWTRRVSCFDSARVDPAYPAEIAAKYGAESNVYRVRVLGEFPQSEDDVVIPLDLAEAAVDRAVEGVVNAPVVWGLDVARFGDDRSALAKRKGNRLIEPVRAWQGKDLMQTAGMVAEEWGSAPDRFRADEILVDVIGLGAGVVDRLRELKVPARGINVAESAAVGERYLRLRDELWFKAADWFRGRDVTMPRDDDLIGELCSVKYRYTSAGKLQVEQKDDMKKRGMASPDLADAFVLTFAGASRPAFPTQRRQPPKLGIV